MALLTASGAQAAAPYLAQFKAGNTKTYVASQYRTLSTVDVTFKYPSGWTTEADDTGTFVQSEDGRVNCVVFFTEGPNYTAANLRAAFSDPDTALDAGPGAEILSSDRPIISGQPAFEFIYRTSVSGGRVTTQNMSDYVAVDGALISLQCLTGNQVKSEAIAAFDEALPLFRLIAAPMTIQPK